MHAYVHSHNHTEAETCKHNLSWQVQWDAAESYNNYDSSLEKKPQ